MYAASFQLGQFGAEAASAQAATVGFTDAAGYSYQLDVRAATIKVTGVPPGGGNLGKSWGIDTSTGGMIVANLARMSSTNLQRLQAALGASTMQAILSAHPAASTGSGSGSSGGSPSSTPPSALEPSNGKPFPWAILIVGVAVVGLAVTVFAVRRRRKPAPKANRRKR